MLRNHSSDINEEQRLLAVDSSSTSDGEDAKGNGEPAFYRKRERSSEELREREEEGIQSLSLSCLKTKLEQKKELIQQSALYKEYCRLAETKLVQEEGEDDISGGFHDFISLLAPKKKKDIGILQGWTPPKKRRSSSEEINDQVTLPISSEEEKSPDCFLSSQFEDLLEMKEEENKKITEMQEKIEEYCRLKQAIIINEIAANDKMKAEKNLTEEWIPQKSSCFPSEETNDPVILPPPLAEKKSPDFSLRSQSEVFLEKEEAENKKITESEERKEESPSLKQSNDEKIEIKKEPAANDKMKAERNWMKSYTYFIFHTMNDPTHILSVKSITHALLMVVLAESAYDLVEDCGAAPQPFMHTAFFSWGMPLLLATLAFEGFSSAFMACLDKKTQDRSVAMLEGLSKGVNSTLLFVLRLGLIPTTAATLGYLMPGLFFIIIVGMIIKEERLLRLTQKKISDLETRIIANQNALLNLNMTSDSSENSAGDPNDKENRLEASNHLSQQNVTLKNEVDILKVEERRMYYSKWGLRAALVSVALMMIAAAFPPLGLTAVVLTTTALAIFFMLLTAIRLIKKNEQKEIQKIKNGFPTVGEAGQVGNKGFFSRLSPSQGSEVSARDRRVAEKAPAASSPAPCFSCWGIAR